jgi:hypothetical protein
MHEHAGKGTPVTDTTFEKHYTIAQLTELWGLSKETVRREVLKEHGVAKVRGPRGRTAYRIPESVARRIHTRLVAPAGQGGLALAR